MLQTASSSLASNIPLSDHRASAENVNTFKVDEKGGKLLPSECTVGNVPRRVRRRLQRIAMTPSFVFVKV